MTIFMSCSTSTTVTPESAQLIATSNLAGIRSLLDKLTQDPKSGSHTMNDDLTQLIKKRKVSVEDARRASTDTGSLADLPVTWVCADLGSVAELRGVFAGADVVFHCAAYVSTRSRVTPAISAVNVGATRAVVEAATGSSSP